MMINNPFNFHPGMFAKLQYSTLLVNDFQELALSYAYRVEKIVIIYIYISL